MTEEKFTIGQRVVCIKAGNSTEKALGTYTIARDCGTGIQRLVEVSEIPGDPFCAWRFMPMPTLPLCINGLTEETSRALQEAAFRGGFRWGPMAFETVAYADQPALQFEEKSINFYLNPATPENVSGGAQIIQALPHYIEPLKLWLASGGTGFAARKSKLPPDLLALLIAAPMNPELPYLIRAALLVIVPGELFAQGAEAVIDWLDAQVLPEVKIATPAVAQPAPPTPRPPAEPTVTVRWSASETESGTATYTVDVSYSGELDIPLSEFDGLTGEREIRSRIMEYIDDNAELCDGDYGEYDYDVVECTGNERNTTDCDNLSDAAAEVIAAREGEGEEEEPTTDDESIF